MALKDFVPQKELIKAGETDFEVKGLTAEDIVLLMALHFDDISAMVEGKIDIATLIKDKPDFTGQLIATASGEKGAVEQAKSLPMGVQVLAITKIWEMTQVDMSDLGNLIRGFVTGMEGLNKELSENEKVNSKSGASISKSRSKVLSQTGTHSNA